MTSFADLHEYGYLCSHDLDSFIYSPIGYRLMAYQMDA